MDQCSVPPSEVIEVLGVSFDKLVSPNPYLKSLISAAKTLSAMSKRLKLHLPPHILRTVMGALVREN